ncbi:MAG: hypothetical protein Q7K45_01540, partial [Nanoarchaeota archaeon]|nr:hypothetical protein [Nanoarchaeota archaeon]
SPRNCSSPRNCFDSDGGINLLVGGFSTEILASSSGSSFGSFVSDYCNSNGTMNEGICLNGHPSRTSEACPVGTRCLAVPGAAHSGIRAYCGR